MRKTDQGCQEDPANVGGTSGSATLELGSNPGLPVSGQVTSTLCASVSPSVRWGQFQTSCAGMSADSGVTPLEPGHRKWWLLLSWPSQLLHGMVGGRGGSLICISPPVHQWWWREVSFLSLAQSLCPQGSAQPTPAASCPLARGNEHIAVGPHLSHLPPSSRPGSALKLDADAPPDPPGGASQDKSPWGSADLPGEL